mmetsp:Transcript_40225/g.86300  ORF Transcript_40225/g.86300 Transcript_40225/m.86300 type:complete len:347 (-) Transcript_40225:1057-2097(-)
MRSCRCQPTLEGKESHHPADCDRQVSDPVDLEMCSCPRIVQHISTPTTPLGWICLRIRKDRSAWIHYRPPQGQQGASKTRLCHAAACRCGHATRQVGSRWSHWASVRGAKQSQHPDPLRCGTKLGSTNSLWQIGLREASTRVDAREGKPRWCQHCWGLHHRFIARDNSCFWLWWGHSTWHSRQRSHPLGENGALLGQTCASLGAEMAATFAGVGGLPRCGPFGYVASSERLVCRTADNSLKASCCFCRCRCSCCSSRDRCCWCCSSCECRCCECCCWHLLCRSYERTTPWLPTTIAAANAATFPTAFAASCASSNAPTCNPFRASASTHAATLESAAAFPTPSTAC